MANQEPDPRPPPPQAGRHASRVRVWVIAGGGVYIALSVLGFFAYATGHPNPSDKAVTLDPNGDPQIVTVSCRGQGIGRVSVVRKLDGAIVFTAALKPGGTPRPSLSLAVTPDPDYDTAFPLGPLDPETVYDPRSVEDEHGNGIGFYETAFKPSDLRRDAANGGFTYDGNPLPSTPLSQWRQDTTPGLRCS